jgi:hypothetical protein
MANKAAAKSVVASKLSAKTAAKAHVIGNRVAMKVQY